MLSQKRLIKSLFVLFIALLVVLPSFVQSYRVLDDDDTDTQAASSSNNEMSVQESKKLQTALKIVKAYLEYQIDEIDGILSKQGKLLLFYLTII